MSSLFSGLAQGKKIMKMANYAKVVKKECINNYKKILDEVIKNIMTGLSGDNEIFVNNEAFKEKIDNLVFQYIRETFKIKKQISKENIITNVMLKYNVQSVNKVANHVSEVTDTVSKHGQFILEQTQYNEDAENEKANCTLIIRDIEKFEIPLEEGQRGKQFSAAVKKKKNSSKIIKLTSPESSLSIASARNSIQ